MTEGFVCHVNELDAIPDAVYIGRRANRFRLDESPFYNPYLVKDLGRDEAIRRYIDHLIRAPDLVQRLPELRGRPLACWCRRSDQSEPPCHGDVLVRILRDIPDSLLERARLVQTNPTLYHEVTYMSCTGSGVYAIDMTGLTNRIYWELFPLAVTHG